ncbi:MAG: hypothetical protein HUU01_03505 [Saprospiraceae bacterium]|nr:hypothetical protein [Saprospiraceae bacterium]
MLPEDSILLWKYIDGQCLPEEARQLEQRMAQDADLKAAWELRIRLNQSLRQLPLEQPSLRFALNVMDRLPAMVKKINIAPLVSTRWLKSFTATMATIVCAALALVSGGEPASMSSHSPSFSKITDHFSAIFERLPYNYLMVGAAVAFGFILLEAIERRFAKP